MNKWKALINYLNSLPYIVTINSEFMKAIAIANLLKQKPSKVITTNLKIMFAED